MLSVCICSPCACASEVYGSPFVCVNTESESYTLMERGAYTTAAI